MALNNLQKCKCLSNLIQNYHKINYRQITTSLINLTPRFNNNNNHPDSIKIKNNDDELKTLQEIENTLFDNVQHKPVNTNKLLNEFKIEDQKQKSTDYHRKQSEQKRITKQNQKDSIFDDNLGIHYKKLKLNDPQLSKLFLTVRGKKNKTGNNNLIITEGWRLISEALDCGLKLEALIFNRKEFLKPILSAIKKQNNENIYKVPQETLRTWSTLTTCPGLIAIFDRTNNNKIHKSNDDKQYNKQIIYPITVICDNIRESNNLGSIIRTCAAVPCSQVIVMKGCCNPWETKALRGGCGGQFRININDNIKWENINDYLPDIDLSVFIAESNLKKTIDYPLCEYTDITVSKKHHNCLVIGGETEGISEDAYKFMRYRATYSSCINIPLANGIDSLNTSSALTLILFEIRKHLKLLKNNDENEIEEQMDSYKSSYVN